MRSTELDLDSLLKTVIERAEQETQAASDAKNAAENAKRAVELELALLRTELEQTKLNEARLTGELNDAQSSIARLTAANRSFWVQAATLGARNAELESRNAKNISDLQTQHGQLSANYEMAQRRYITLSDDNALLERTRAQLHASNGDLQNKLKLSEVELADQKKEILALRAEKAANEKETSRAQAEISTQKNTIQKLEADNAAQQSELLTLRAKKPVQKKEVVGVDPEAKITSLLKKIEEYKAYGNELKNIIKKQRCEIAALKESIVNLSEQEDNSDISLELCAITKPPTRPYEPGMFLTNPTKKPRGCESPQEEVDEITPKRSVN